MRTTIELPDELYRAVKSRAALDGCAMKDLVRRYVESGLVGERPHEPARRPRSPLPVFPFGRTGVPLPAMTPDDIRRLEEEEDLERYDRLTRR